MSVPSGPNSPCSSETQYLQTESFPQTYRDQSWEMWQRPNSVSLLAAWNPSASVTSVSVLTVEFPCLDPPSSLLCVIHLLLGTRFALCALLWDFYKCCCLIGRVSMAPPPLPHGVLYTHVRRSQDYFIDLLEMP